MRVHCVLSPRGELLGVWSCGADAAEHCKTLPDSFVRVRELNSGVKACQHAFERQPRQCGEPVTWTCVHCGAYQ